MHVTVEIPDELAATLAPAGRDPARAALEAIGLEAYRERMPRSMRSWYPVRRRSTAS